jgi:glycosyltransferase involved in cell wall biosynthesis
MKILHVVPTYLPAVRYGGPIVAVHGLCRALVARGHDVDVFTTNVDGQGTLDVPIAEPVLLDGVRVTYFPSPFPRLYWSPMMRKAFKSIREYDVVHTHAVYLWPGVGVARAARNAKVPYIVSPRGMLVPELIRRKNRWLKTVWLHTLERSALSDAAAIHFTSQLESDEAKRLSLPLPLPVVVPNGIDPETRPEVAREERLLVFLGRVSWKKGLDRVIEALPSLAGVRLVIAGNDEENLTPSLQSLAEGLGVADRVEFTGPVYGTAKQELLARATLFVLMSTSENFGNAVLEALAMETPVVLSADVGLSAEVVRANAGATGLSSIPELLQDPARRAEMGRNGRQLVESQFTWPRIAEAMENVYRCSIRSPR